ncbi:hypothetical protein CHS0354_029950, partial [Potamilus streckersoni]
MPMIACSVENTEKDIKSPFRQVLWASAQLQSLQSTAGSAANYHSFECAVKSSSERLLHIRIHQWMGVTDFSPSMDG